MVVKPLVPVFALQNVLVVVKVLAILQQAEIMEQQAPIVVQ